MFKVNVFDDKEISISAEDQVWTQDDCKRLLKDYNIIYENGIAAIWIEKRKNSIPLLHLMGEDDGHLYWHIDKDIYFNFCWLNDYISLFTRTKDYVLRHPKKFNIKEG